MDILSIQHVTGGYLQVSYKTLHYILGNTQFKNFIATSNPRKHAAFAGNARSITGTHPLYNALGPSSFIRITNTSRIPFLNMPSGAK